MFGLTCVCAITSTDASKQIISDGPSIVWCFQIFQHRTTPSVWPTLDRLGLSLCPESKLAKFLPMALLSWAPAIFKLFWLLQWYRWGFFSASLFVISVL